MPTRRLPADPNLTQLNEQAKELLDGHRARQPAALQRLREFHPQFHGATDEAIAVPLDLADAQLAIAHEYGFRSWPRLEAFVENPRNEDLLAARHTLITDPLFRRAVELLDAGDEDGLRAHLKAHPEIARKRVNFEGWNYFRDPALLEFIAENPTRNGSLPKNIAELARIILDAGGKDDRASLDDSLGLVASSNIARECGVQDALIDVLCDYGADPREAHYPAALYAEFDAVGALIRRGLPVDLLVATELNRIDDVRATVALADATTLQKALAMAAQWGYTDSLRMILDAGADPNQYAPVGGHSHATPLHQAALGGHLDAVRLLVERGARTDIRDIHHNDTPLGWARYGKHPDVVAYLEPITN
jgi:hypothetical protein